jgi:Cu2+-exporting ATPase
LQAASDIDTVVFDLNGTLTQGDVSVNSINMDHRNSELLKYFALLEGRSAHPVAIKIKQYIEGKNVVVDESLEIASVDRNHHSGIKGAISGEVFMIGNSDMLRTNGVETINAPYDEVKNGTIYMVRGKEVVGQIALTDHLRQDARVTVNQLQLMGKQVHICTGADQETAERFAQLLGISIDNICANTVGAAALDDERSKESYIRLLQGQGRKVAMVGDAANDLTAIASADIGIAVKSKIGDTFMEQHAGMVVQQGLLFPIATAFDVASKTKQNIFQNLFVSLTYNSLITLVAAGLFLALGFALNPAIGIALMVVESAIVLANLYRLKHQETVTIASNQGDPFDSDQTTSKILNGLGFSPKSCLDKHNDRVIDADPDEQEIIQPGKAYGFFEPMRTAANDRSIVLVPSAAESFH